MYWLNLLLHLLASVSIFAWLILSYVLANGLRNELMERGRPVLAWSVSIALFFCWPLLLTGMIGWALYSYNFRREKSS